MPQAVASRLADTRAAFDSVAPDYDGPRGNNTLVQDMRAEMWSWLDRTFPEPSRLLDLGCGTGLDVVRMAGLGHCVTATDWSDGMLERTRVRAENERVAERVEMLAVGAHELGRIPGTAIFNGAYSNLGALNCVPDPSALAGECARLLKPGGALVFAVIGRVCPWEIGYYLARAGWQRLKVRFASGMVPVRMNGRVVWTRYYRPREFYRAFEREFELVHYRGLCVLVPPPYLARVKTGYPRAYECVWRIDRRTAGWPVLRDLGDHFLIVMRKR
ncbi:MAG TPA: methyltransferase domain-containing protein [Steroidobacteraceae bacterium]|nr:methyltransferase domain-containing protein [Steroidobacteraceae bacterium]